MKEFQKILAEKTAETEAVLAKFLPEETGLQKTILAASNYSMQAGGKRLRPLIMRETFRAFGGEESEIEAFMAAMEMIHTSSLVHDDLPCMDNDEYRRGKKTTWSVFGEDMGVLAGDALLTMAFETASSVFETTKHPRRAGRAISVLSGKTGVFGMIGGQTVDVELTGKQVKEEQLLFIHRLKTGALLEASMMVGCILAGGSPEQIAECETIAGLVGLAFQIRDDILDVTSTTEELGKPVNSDEKNQKVTYVTLYGLDKAEEMVAAYSEEAEKRLRTMCPEAEFLNALFEALISRTR